MSGTGRTAPRWSVIVPVYERTEQLSRALRSIDRCRGEAAIETIIADDGSSSPVAATLDELSDDETTTVVHLAHAGPAAARNAGLAVAAGTWVVLLDSDDELADGAIASFERARLGCPAGGLICATMRQVQHDGTSFAVLPIPHPALGGRRISATAGSFAVRRDVARAVGGYDVAMTFGENTDLVLRAAEWCLAHDLEIVATDEVVSTYYAAGHERRYDERRWKSAVHLLHRGRIDLADPAERAKHHGIVAVNATRSGNYATAVRHAAAALRCEPTHLRHLARLGATLTGPAARWWWLRT